MPSLKLKPWQRRSRNEEQFEAELKKRNIKYTYEPRSFELMPNMKGTDGMIGAITYTPDFKLEFPNGKVLWVEVKGFARAADMIKDKLADWYITNKLGEGYIMVTQYGAIKRGTKDWFRYSQSNVLSRIDNAIKDGKTITVGKSQIDPYKMFDNQQNFWQWLEEWVGPNESSS